MIETQVLVVGGGPVGMATALALAGEGLDVRVIDQYQRSALHSYALALHPATLRVLDRYGLAEDLREKGRTIGRIAIFEGSEQTAMFDLAAAGDAHPDILLLPQTHLEGLLESELQARGVEIEWGHQAMSFDSDDDGVTTLVGRMGPDGSREKDPTGGWGIDETVRIRSSVVIGADGPLSTVRRLLGAHYTTRGETEHYYLFEFDSADEVVPEIRLVFHGASAAVLWPLTNRRARWNFQVDSQNTSLEPAPDLQALRALTAERAPWFSPIPEQVDWSTTVAFDRQIVDRFGDGRVWLVGDAAHRIGPVGVLSMNLGIQEGCALARRVREVLGGSSASKELAGYALRVGSEWLRLLSARDQLELTAKAPEWVRRIGGRLVECLPLSGEDLDPLLDRLGMIVPAAHAE